MPGIVTSAFVGSESNFGIEPSSACVYGWRIDRNSSSVGAVSTRRPAYITLIRSVRPATTPMSWVTSNVAIPSRSLSSSSTDRICAWIVTSSAVVGSSASSTRGSQVSAIAIITRWRNPPDSWCG